MTVPRSEYRLDPAYYLPATTPVHSSRWIGIPDQSNLHELIDELPGTEDDDASLVTFTGAFSGDGSDTITFGFGFPLSYTEISNGPRILGLLGIEMVVRMRGEFTSTEDVDIYWAFRRGNKFNNKAAAFVLHSGPFVLGGLPGPWADYRQLFENDPITHKPWVMEDLAVTQIGFSYTQQGNNPQFTSLYMIANEEARVEGRTRQYRRR